VRSLEVEAAAATGDFDAATAALERLRSSTNPVWPFQRAYVLRAEGAAARLRNALEAGRQLLAAAQELSEMPGVAASLAYEALRAGGPAVTELDAFEARSGCRLISAFAAHARARAAGDGTALLAAADTFGDIGAIRYAVEAASEAATAFVHEGRQNSARRAAHRAESLHVPGQGADLPRIDGLDAVAIALTRREAQLVEMAAQGLSNAEIADRLVLSVRTVETHLYRAMQKLGVSDRRDL
jgi:ATP/maltotriose-dependent transcriptional regulator MalT